ncbi:MAG: hypothetical protein IIA87_03405 [Nanoarchaeota archaeon]|nr:hypothetical protein [Nanoarchaeota archaeon]
MLAEINTFDFNNAKDMVEHKRKALVKVDNIESAQELSPMNMQMDQEKYDKIFPEKVFAIKLLSGTTFLIDKNEYNDIRKFGGLNGN